MNNILNSSGSDTSSYMLSLDVSMGVEEEISPEEDHRSQQLQLCSAYNSSYNHNSSSFNYPPNQYNFDQPYPQVSSNNQLLPLLNYASQYHVQLPLAPSNEYSNQLGLELGRHPYYPSTESSWALAKFFQSRGCYYGFGNQAPRCQAEGCKADLTSAKRYHRRHKVCESHSKASVVHLGGGIMQRFCQQCSRFHMLDEFDDSKKSCRRRLEDHNRRRRKAKPNSLVPSSFATTPINTTQAKIQEQHNAQRQTNAAAIPREQEVQMVPNSKGKVINTSIQANLNPQRGWLHASICSSKSGYETGISGPSSVT